MQLFNISIDKETSELFIIERDGKLKEKKLETMLITMKRLSIHHDSQFLNLGRRYTL